MMVSHALQAARASRHEMMTSLISVDLSTQLAIAPLLHSTGAAPFAHCSLRSGDHILDGIRIVRLGIPHASVGFVLRYRRFVDQRFIRRFRLEHVDLTLDDLDDTRAAFR